MRLYRYIDTDLLWGLKEMGVKLMSKNELYFEFLGSVNTIQVNTCLTRSKL